MGKRKRDIPKPHIPDDLIFNVLKRLPAKSLMRFKCVCTAWHDLIRDPQFAESHYVHSKSRPDASYVLFYIGIWPVKGLFPTTSDADFSTGLPIHTFHYCTPCTEIVNGLVCMINNVNPYLELHNLTTREKLALPGIRGSLPPVAQQSYIPSYFLGFDPVERKYKVLHFRRGQGRDEDKIQKCFVLTVGTKSWRETANRSEFSLMGMSFSLNGAIYWKDTFLIKDKRVLQYFDVRQEKFLIHSGPILEARERIDFLTEVGGNLALGDFKFNVLTLWTFKKEDQVWYKDTIPLPYTEISSFGLKAFGTINTGEMLIEPRWWGAEPEGRFIFCDLKTKEFRRKDIVLPTWPPTSSATLLSIGTLLSQVARVATSNHVENIQPLHSQAKKWKKATKKQKNQQKR